MVSPTVLFVGNLGRQITDACGDSLPECQFAAPHWGRDVFGCCVVVFHTCDITPILYACQELISTELWY